MCLGVGQGPCSSVVVDTAFPAGLGNGVRPHRFLGWSSAVDSPVMASPDPTSGPVSGWLARSVLSASPALAGNLGGKGEGTGKVWVDSPIAVGVGRVRAWSMEEANPCTDQALGL